MQEQIIERIMLQTKDPTVDLHGHPIPALTTLLHRVCDNDPGKYEEAVRLIELFIQKTIQDVGRHVPESHDV